MIKRILLIIILLGPMLSYSQKTYVPDDIFEAWCEGNGFGDGIAFNDSVSTNAVSILYSVDIGGKNITDLTGIEDFSNLEYLYADQNLFPIADFRQNYNLRNFNISYNDSLRYVYFPDSINHYRSVANGTLNVLSLGYVDIYYCPNLDSLNLPDYNIYHLYAVGNTNLSYIDLSAQLYTDALYLSYSDSLQSIDIRNMGYLRTLYAEGIENLSELDLRNGNIVNLNNHNFQSNPNLTCISVDNTTLANALLTNIDPGVTFDYNCTGLGCMDPFAYNFDQYATIEDSSCLYNTYTYVPDDNFENYLEANGMGDGIALNDTVLTSNINTVNNLYLDSLSINNLIGIQDFISLTSLIASNNPIDSVDLSNNDSLIHINFSHCNIDSIDVSNLNYLQQLQLNSNQIVFLDVTQNINLHTLQIDYNLISNIDVSQNTNLQQFLARDNLLTSIDLSYNLQLVSLMIGDNSLNNIDLTNNINIQDLRIRNIQAQYIDVSSLSNLKMFVCQNNFLDSLNLTNNPLLEQLFCNDNLLTNINVTSNPLLNTLLCQTNLLTNLDVSSCFALVDLQCETNNLTTLDISNNSNLTLLYCSYNDLNYLDVRNGNNTNFINNQAFNALGNSNLTCISVDDSIYSTNNWPNIDPQSYFSNNCNSSLGCTDSNACNYDPSATTDDGSCIIGNCVENITQNTFTADIQSGINSALSGDTLVAYQGTYFENIYIDKRIILSSEYIFNNDTSYISSTIIDGSQDSTVVHIDTANVILKGFTVTNGYSNYGAGITAHGNGIVLTDLNVINNLAQGDLDGGGAAISGDVHILNSKFVNNQGRKGGAILMSWGSPLIENCQFSNNNCTESGAVFQIMSSTPTIINALITNNGDIGSLNNMNLIYTQGNTADAVFINSTITANSTLGYIALTHSGAISFLNSILYNDGFNEAGDYSGSFPSSISFSNCNVQGIALTNGNIDSSPLLNNDFTLSDNSACIGAGLDSSIVPLLDLNGAPRPNPIGSNPDIGAYENLLDTPLSDSCNFIFELWNYLPPPGAQNIGWSNPNGTYNSLYIYNNGVYLDSITNFSGGNYTSEVYYFNFNNLDTIDVIFNNYGSAANECMYRVYDSFGGLIATQGFPGSPPGNVNFVSVCDSSTLTPGCTDPYALNYDSLAVIDNGSCTYSGLSLDPVSDSLCLGDTVVITWTGGNPSDNILLRTINNTLWQTGFTIAIIPNTGSYTWVVSNFPAGPGDLYQFYIEDTPNQNSWDYGSVFAICPIYGCVDPLATNFDPQATLDNGSCLYPNYNNTVVIDSINAINPILCYGNLGDIEVFVDNDTSSFGTGTNLVTYQLKAFKVGSSSTFSYFSSSQTNASSVVANGLDQSTYYLLVVDSVAFNSTYNPFSQYFSNSTFINTVLNDPAVYDFDSIYLSEPTELVNSISTVSSNLCFGDCDASELITVSGGVMPYSLNGINLLQSDTLLSNLCAGNYAVNITDANGCQVSNLFSFITIVEPPLAQSFDSVFTCNTYLWNGSLLDSTGWYYDTLATNNSCDSIASLYLSIIPCYGCTDPNALNYDSTATVDDGSCTYLIYGCTDPIALNYDSLANIDDGSCLYCSYGCTDPNALNYDSLATCDDGSCIPLVYGCTDSLAINYFSGANTDDGSCIYAGCTDSTALNYDSTATIDDGSCYYGGCQDPAPINIFADAITDNKATINWANMNSNSCMVLKYVIRYRELGTNSWTTKSGGAGNGLCNFGLNNTSKTLLNLASGTTYQYKIKAFYCFGGSSVWTLPKLFTTEDVCPPMTNLSVQTFPSNTNKATFSWDSTGAYVFARIALRENNSGASWQTAGGFGIYYPTLSVNKFGLQSGTDYRAQGRTFCDSNITSYRSWWTPLIFWTQPGTIRLNGSSNIKDLQVYPNPSRDKFNIVFRSDEVQRIEVRVLNILGKVVFQDDLFEFVGEYTRAIDLSDFEKAIYFLEIETVNGKINKKLVLQ